MMKFKHGTRRRALEYEKDWVKRWKDDKTFEKSVEQRPKDNSYVFYDGPPFISGNPHHGTLLSSIVKDAVPRYQTMKGKRVKRVWGWDCHGLPAERYTEQKLGIKSREEVIEYGIEKYINATRENMEQTSSEWEEVIDRIGRWVDFKGAYRTMDKDYMESIWWAFKELYEKGKIYEGEKVLMYCTLDGTPLSKAEVTMDAGAYQDVTDPSVYVKFKLKNNNKDVSVRALSEQDGEAERKFLMMVPENENGFGRPAKEDDLISNDAFKKYLKKMVGVSKGVGLRDGYVPQTIYWVEFQGEIVGVAKVRHYLNDSLRNEGGGHIGIGGIDKKYRGKGVGTEALRLLIEKARELGEKDILLTVHEDNIGSVRMVEKNGGVVEKVIDDPKFPGVKEVFYWIKGGSETLQNDVYLLAWTTTPWTLPANTALAVNEELDYVEVRVGDDQFILAKERLGEVLQDEKHQPLEYEIVRELKGKDLVGLEYEPLFENRGKNAHKVWSADYVSHEDGTGIVHLAPTYGEEDFELAKKNKIPAVHTIDQNGFFTEGPWQGKNVWEVNKQIAKDLKEQGVVWKIDYIRHSYPHCHRCGTRLMYRAHPSWFVNIDDQRELMLEKNEPINWFPPHVKHGRFEKTIEQAPDWNISRDRFWATAMPVWKSESGKTRVVGSYAELKELSGVELEDYHRPWIDDVKFTIDDEEYTRIDKVMDSWFEAGSMSFAQFHYPFENKEKFEANFPGDFIVEYIAQTRAWFYYMHAVSVALFGENSFKNVIVTGTLAGSDGRKMSKSYGNYTDPNELMDKFSADSLRFLLLSSPLLSGEDFSLQDKEVGDVARKLSMIWNMYDFFTMYAEVDGWEYDGKLEDPLEELINPLDIWIVSRLHQLVAEVEKHMDGYNLPDAMSPILPFIDDASNWYVRRSRRRFWKSEFTRDQISEKGSLYSLEYLENDKNDAYRTLHYVLVRLAYLLAPFTPFLAEELYRNLTGDEESIHLKDWLPAGKVNQLELDRMDLVREVINEGLSQRAEHSIKVRQPLAGVNILGDGRIDLLDIEDQDARMSYLDIVEDELNVKATWTNNKRDKLSVELDLEITPELKREGLMREVIRHVQQARKNAGLNVDDRIVLSLETDNSDLKKAIDEHAETIKAETLATELTKVESGYEVKVKIEQAELGIVLQKT